MSARCIDSVIVSDDGVELRLAPLAEGDSDPTSVVRIEVKIDGVDDEFFVDLDASCCERLVRFFSGQVSR